MDQVQLFCEEDGSANAGRRIKHLDQLYLCKKSGRDHLPVFFASVTFVTPRMASLAFHSGGNMYKAISQEERKNLYVWEMTMNAKQFTCLNQ